MADNLLTFTPVELFNRAKYKTVKGDNHAIILVFCEVGKLFNLENPRKKELAVIRMKKSEYFSKNRLDIADIIINATKELIAEIAVKYPDRVKVL